MIQRFPFRVFAPVLIAAAVAPMALKWWLLSEPDAPKSVHWKEAFLVVALYAISVANLLEIYVIYEHAAHPPVPLLPENNQPPPFPPRTNPQSTQKTQTHEHYRY
jgi:hypothetical protein